MGKLCATRANRSEKLKNAIPKRKKTIFPNGKRKLNHSMGIEHLHIYLFGHKFALISDAKALEMRLERWRLGLQAYDFDVRFKPGHLNMSDYISRHPGMTNEKQKMSVIENRGGICCFHCQIRRAKSYDAPGNRTRLRQQKTLTCNR